MSTVAVTGKISNEQSEDYAINYKDWWLPVILIPFVTAFNYYLFYSKLHFNAHSIVTYISDLIQGIVGWYAARIIIIRLDHYYPWLVFPVKRLVFQLIGTTIIGIGTISVLNEIDYAWLRQRPIDKSGFYSFDIFIIFIWVLTINGIYISLYFYQLYTNRLIISQQEPLITESTNSAVDSFIVKLGKQEIKLDCSEMLLFYIEQQAVLLLTTGQTKYVMDFSLDSLEAQLNSTMFFRANRQFIISRSAIKSFTKQANGKLLVSFKEGLGVPDQIRIGRLRAPAFKTWLKAE
jgi:hypothetical protein